MNTIQHKEPKLSHVECGCGNEITKKLYESMKESGYEDWMMTCDNCSRSLS